MKIIAFLILSSAYICTGSRAKVSKFGDTDLKEVGTIDVDIWVHYGQIMLNLTYKLVNFNYTSPHAS